MEITLSLPHLPHNPDLHDRNLLPDKKILDWSKLKAFADDKINVDEVRNLVWEG